MTIVHRWALALIAALLISATGAEVASAAPLGGLNQAATSVQTAAKTTDLNVAPQSVRYYRRRFYGRRFYRRRYYRHYYRPYYRPYYRHYYRPYYRPYRFFF